MPLLQRNHFNADLQYTKAVCDLSFICSDGTVTAHQAVFSWSSTFLRRLFTSRLLLENGIGKRKEDLVIIMLKFSALALDGLSKFLETGAACFQGDKSVKDDFANAWNLLKVDSISLEKAFVDILSPKKG